MLYLWSKKLLSNLCPYKKGEIVFESIESGEYIFKPEYTGLYQVIIVGAGGGGASETSALYGTEARAGGSGGMITGTAKLTRGSEYTIVVGAGGIGRHAADTASGSSGGHSTFFGNTAYGGGGASCNVWSGSYNSGGGGSATAIDGFTASNGVSGSTTSRYGVYGGGGAPAQNGQNGYVQISFSH